MNTSEFPPRAALRVRALQARWNGHPWRLHMIRSARVGCRFGVGAAFGTWVGDATVLVVSNARATWSQRLAGAGVALFVALSSAIALGCLLGPALVPLGTSAFAIVSQRWNAVRKDGREVLAASLTAITLAALMTWLGCRAIVDIELRFARPETTAVALIGFTWTFAAAAAFLLPQWHRAVRGFLDRTGQAPGLRLMIRRAWWTFAVAVVVATVVAGRRLLAHPQDVFEGAFRYAAPGCGLVAGLACAAYLPGSSRPWAVALRRGSIALWVTALLGAAAAVRLRPESSVARTIAFDESWSGFFGYAVWTAAFDFDRDGQLNVLGDGDCAPFDPRRYTGAVEIPGNGVDEDCDGADLAVLPFGPRPSKPVGQSHLAQRPTIVLITIDALGAPRLQSLGRPTSIMPHLDDYAGRSMLFTHCFSEGPSTRLSFPSMFTSRYDSELDFEAGPSNPYSLTPSQRQLQDVLDDTGYETVAVIPQDYFDRNRWPGVTRGFQRVDRTALSAGPHNAPQVTDAALRILSEERNRPLYMWIHYFDAHAPYVRLPGVTYPNETEEALYEGQLHYIDTELERLVDALDHRPERPYVFVTADHSTVFHPDRSRSRAHYGFDLYTATLHVPLIVHGPGIPAGRNDALVSTMDVAPTIADLLRVRDTPFEGTSLMPELLAGAVDTRRAVFHEFYLPERLFHGYEPLEIASLHSGRYNLVLHRTRGIYELYDFTSDYFERSDLYEQLARSPEVLRLKSLLGTFIAHVDSGEHRLAEPGTDRVFELARP